jgi:hypothetical protein
LELLTLKLFPFLFIVLMLTHLKIGNLRGKNRVNWSKGERQKTSRCPALERKGGECSRLMRSSLAKVILKQMIYISYDKFLEGASVFILKGKFLKD